MASLLFESEIASQNPQDRMVAQLAVQTEVLTTRAPIIVPRVKSDHTVPSSPADEDSKKQVGTPLPRRSSRIAASQRTNASVHASIETAIRKLNVKETEARKLRSICSLEDLQHFVNAENKLHHQNIENTNGGKFQSVLVKVDDFAKAYEPILGAFKEAVPNGGGHAVWALLGGFFLVAQRKDRREKAITEFLSRLKYSLPRSDRYRELYQSSTTIKSLHEQLHIVIINALLQAYDYFRDKRWTGTLARISSAMGIHDALAEVFDEVAKISSEIDSESMLELRNEVREAHTESSQIKKEAEMTNSHLTEMKEKLLLANNQLLLVNDQLEATKKLSVSLQKKLDDIRAQSLSELAGKLKLSLVPLSYVTSDIISSCEQQVRSSNRRSQQLRQLNTSPDWKQWQSSKKRASTNLIWVTDKRHANSSISIVPLKAIDDLAKSQLVMHSLYQTGETVSSLPHNARTATTILGEAMYQLLCRCPDAWQRYKPASGQDRATPFEDAINQFVELLDAYSDNNASDGRVVVYWLIDRIDTVFWRTDNSSLGLLEGPPQLGDLNNLERKEIARASSTVEDFLEHLSSMPHRKDRNAGIEQLRKKNWELKVLVSSHYELSALRGSHGGDEDIVWGPGNWIDLVV